MDFDHPTYFLYPYRSASLNFSHLLQTTPWLLWFYQSPKCFQNHSFKQDFLDDLQLVFDTLLMLPNPSVRLLTLQKEIWLSLILPVSKHSLPRIIPSTLTESLSNSRHMLNPKALINLMIPIKLPMVPCLPMLLRILRWNSCISMGIFLCLQVWHCTIGLGIIRHISSY